MDTLYISAIRAMAAMLGSFRPPSYALSVGCATPNLFAASISLILFCILASLNRHGILVPSFYSDCFIAYRSKPYILFYHIKMNISTGAIYILSFSEYLANNIRFRDIRG